MQAKIANAIDCLKTHPHSKRAIIPIPFNSEGSANVDWNDAGQTKCCRELHLYIEGEKLCCTGFLRVQNATIFPKNIHFFATLLQEVASGLGREVGEYTHIISSVCHDRSATQC
jgi:thymidylate synthase